MPAYAFLCAKGYAILHVNYRGSTGFGQRALESLPGNAGRLDVSDVVHAVETVTSSGWVDKNRVGICGGSHGGFLASHCIGQHPNIFKVAAMRNPVTNIATMTTATDIADWCFVEAMGCGYYNPRKFRGATADELKTMWEASPVRYTDRVIAPTLVALGMADQRVPPSQGLEFYHTLRSNGVKTKLLVYDDDDHAIDLVKSEADLWINVSRHQRHAIQAT
jgi:acylaminoacyl-peptidase